MINQYKIVDEFIIVEYYTPRTGLAKRKNILLSYIHRLPWGFDVEELQHRIKTYRTEDMWIQSLREWVKIDSTITPITYNRIMRMAYDITPL